MHTRIERAAAWAGRRLQIDMRYLLSGGFWSGFGQFAVSGSSFVLSLVIARYVSKDAYGTYKYIISLVAILSTLSLSGLAAALLPSIAEGYDGALMESVHTAFRWSLAVFLGAAALAIYYLLVGNSELAIGVLVGGCTSPFIAAYGLYNPFLVGKKDFRRQTIYGGIFTTIVPAVLLIATAILYPTPAALATVYFLSNLVVVWICYRWTLRIYRPDPSKQDPRALTYGKHLSLINVLGGIAGNIDQVLLFHYASAVDLAIYNFATGVVDQTKGPLKMLDNMMQARFVRRTDADIASSINNKMLWLLVAAILFIAVYVPLAPFLYRLLFPAYAAAAQYSQVYAVSLLSIVFFPAASYLEAKRKVRAQYLFNIGNSVLQIVLMAVGVIFWGLWGIIWARMAVRLIGGTLPYILYRLEEMV